MWKINFGEKRRLQIKLFIAREITHFGQRFMRNEQKKVFGKGLVNRCLIFFAKKIKHRFTKPLLKALLQ